MNARCGSALSGRLYRLGVRQALKPRLEALDDAVSYDFEADSHKLFAAVQNSLYCESLLGSAKITVATYFIEKGERSCLIFSWCGRSVRILLSRKILREVRNSSACCKLSLKTIKKQFG